MTSAILLQQGRAAMAAQNFVQAERAARALILQQQSVEAFELLSNALQGQGRLEEGLAAIEQALALDPTNIAVQHARAFLLSRVGRMQEALTIYDALVARGVVAPQIPLNRAAALFALSKIAEAEATLLQGLKRWPQDQAMQSMLASVRWMNGGADFAYEYGAAVERQPDALNLRIGYADLLRRADQREAAEQVLREGLSRAPGQPVMQGALGVLLDEMDKTEEGLPLLRAAAAAAPNSAMDRGNLVHGLLRLGRADEALHELAPLSAAQPFNGDWICYEAMAYRQLGDPRYRELCDYDTMVQPFDLEAPRGFASVTDFNAALSESLLRLHALETHPLDQSLRHGSQTTRSLLSVDDPIIKQYLTALEEPIRAYIATMQKPNHPWSGRKSERFRLSGCWSVKLKANGYHVNHLHPEGWISSAYYVSLPPAVTAGDNQEGWIKFGEPRWPLPGCTVEKVVQPVEGRLVLFPSYMWHGTIPFSSGERLTAPFDVVPA